MRRRPARLLLTVGILLVVFLITGRIAVELYTELLWFGEVGYVDVFWRRIAAGGVLRLGTGAVGTVLVLVNLARVVRRLGPIQLRRRYGNLEIAEQIPPGFVTGGIILASLLAGWWLSGVSFPRGSGIGLLAWLNRGEWGLADPVFGRDIAFFVFSLPLLGRLLDFLLLATIWSAVLALVGYVLVGAVRLRAGRLEVESHPRSHFALLVAGLILLFAMKYWLARYTILLEGSGFAGGAGYTDVNARLPAYRILAVLSALAAVAVVYSTFRRNWIPALAAVGAVILAGVGLGMAYPSVIQKLRVVPNELAREEPYIRWNLEFTRNAFGLSDIARIPFRVETGQSASVAEAERVIEQLPVWDIEPLQTYFNQRESLFGYYHFPSVHFDRYGPPGRETQVAIAVREFTASGLAAGSRTWRTLHLNADQVRGNGAVVTPATRKTPDGNPVFWLRGAAAPGDTATMPRVERAPDAPPEIALATPAVFFGETTQEYLIVSDPVAPAAAAPTAVGGGVPLDSFLRVLAFAWRFSDRNLLFSSEPTASSRLIFRRSVRERLQALAPFIAWDPRPYPVIAEGRIVWLVDGYTASNAFPVARPYAVPGIGRVRYLRNSVKAVVDGVTGQLALYVIDGTEPIVAAYGRAFPGLFRPLAEMPDLLQRHLRYPLLWVEVQADVLEEYHVDSADAFFAGQIEWQVPQEPAAVGGGRDYAPVYMLGYLPGEERSEFLLVMPFIARERQNMTAIMLIGNDAARYGRITLLELPRDQQISGPRQVRTIIEQDPAISAQLSLWRQGGSDVEIGRLRVVPLSGSIFYVQPIFLSSSGSSIPQLQRLVASDGTSVAMAETLEDAVRALVGDGEPAVPAVAGTVEPAAGEDWAGRALDLLLQSERALRNGAWAEYGRLMGELQALLRRAAAGSR